MIGEDRTKVAVGYRATFMIRPRNWLSRRSSLLSTEARSIEMAADSTVTPLMVSAPSTLPVRPTASVLWPKRISLTRSVKGRVASPGLESNFRRRYLPAMIRTEVSGGGWERGTGNGEQGTGNGEQGIGNG